MEEDMIRVRVEAPLKRAFEQACRARDETMSQAVRRFLRYYVANAGAEQHELFRPAPQAPRRPLTDPATR